jgi:hypothetical protein
MAVMPATQTNWTTLIAKRLRKEGEEVTRCELPRRWVDLIHYLDEQERMREERQAEARRKDQPKQ